MEDTERDKLELNSRSSEYADPRQTEFGYPGNGCGSGSAKYKLLSPAKLPISRSPGITIPPGFSPTSFLESPVLLSSMKVSFYFIRLGSGNCVFYLVVEKLLIEK